MINECVILLGGIGTRLLPITKTIPKELFPIYDKPTIHYLVKEAYDAGIRKIIFVVTDYNIDLIKDYFSKDSILEKRLIENHKEERLELLKELNLLINNIEFIFVKQKIKGTYGALYAAKDSITNDNFIVMYGDDLIDGNNTSELIKNKSMAILINKTDSNIGNVILNKDNYLMDIANTKDDNPHKYTIIGRMLLNKKIFSIIDKLHYSYDNELYLPQALVHHYPGEIKCLINNKPYFNIGSKTGYIEASEYYLNNIKK